MSSIAFHSLPPKLKKICSNGCLEDEKLLLDSQNMMAAMWKQIKRNCPLLNDITANDFLPNLPLICQEVANLETLEFNLRSSSIFIDFGVTWKSLLSNQRALVNLIDADYGDLSIHLKSDDFFESLLTASPCLKELELTKVTLERTLCIY